LLKILPYSDKYADEYILVSIWQALKEDTLIEDVFHIRGKGGHIGSI